MASGEAKSDSLELDHDFAFGAACFDVRQSFVGCFEWKHAIDHGTDSPGLDEAGDFEQLMSIGSHEEERILQLTAFCLFPYAGTQQADDEAHEPWCPAFFAEFWIRRTGDGDELPTAPEHAEGFASVAPSWLLRTTS